MKKRILVVDTSSVVRRYLTKLLNECGYEVNSAKDATELFEHLKTKNYHLILFDTKLPNALEVLASIFEQRSVRVLLLDAYGGSGITMQK